MNKAFSTLVIALSGLLCLLIAAGCGAATADQPTQLSSTAAPTLGATNTAEVLVPTTLVTSSIPTTALTASTTDTPMNAAEATAWVPPTALVGTPIPGAEATLTAAPKLPTEDITFTNQAGEESVMRVEVADTEANRELGLMFRANVDPDAGMLFDFNGDTNGGFWMQNTILPLSIAFVKSDGTIIDVKDMQPLDTTPVGASGPYRYAIEANQGYYRVHNIVAGDKMTIGSARASGLPGMPGCNMAAMP